MIKRALIVQPPYAAMEVDSIKLIECRATNTTIRETVGIIQAGTGLIIGEVTIYDSFKFTESQKKEFQRFHKVEDLKLLDKWCYGWALSNAIRYKKPIKYNHPPGAQLWVRLDKKGVM